MPCFLVTHEVTPEFSAQLLLADEKKVIRSLPREIKWAMSWYMPERGRLVAHWEAPTSQAIYVALERAGLCRTLPILNIEPAIEIYPRRYVARRNAAHAQGAKGRPPARRVKGRARRLRRELSGAFGEAIASTLQTRSALSHTARA